MTALKDFCNKKIREFEESATELEKKGYFSEATHCKNTVETLNTVLQLAGVKPSEKKNKELEAKVSELQADLEAKNKDLESTNKQLQTVLSDLDKTLAEKEELSKKTSQLEQSLKFEKSRPRMDRKLK